MGNVLDFSVANLGTLLLGEEYERYALKLLDFTSESRNYPMIRGISMLISAIIVVPIIVWQWRCRNSVSYRTHSLFALWFGAVVVAACRGWVRFVLMWTIYTIFMSFATCQLCRRSPAQRSGVFLFYMIYTCSVGIVIVGLFSALLSSTLASITFQDHMKWYDGGFRLLLHGLYFSMLSRYIAEMVTVGIAADAGREVSSDRPKNCQHSSVCAICNYPNLPMDSPDYYVLEETLNLPCGHVHHVYAHLVFGEVLTLFKYVITTVPIVFTATVFLRYYVSTIQQDFI